ncbi:MAG TPA: transketolase [Rectinema sp.]|jgi:transketolase|nr:transketolase [Rectinema sp.]
MWHLTKEEIKELNEIARELRCTSLRMIHKRQAGHPGGSLSAAEIMTVLYFKVMRIDPENPNWNERDRFLLSKGHASAMLYATLAKRGFFPEEDLQKWGELDCHLQGHPDRLKTPGVDMNSGILGHGVSIGVGLCLAARQKRKDFRVYTLLGDGECQAGLVWEGANAAAKYALTNLVAIVDHNAVQLDGFVEEVMPIEPLAEKWRSFGWDVFEVDGHDVDQLYQAFLQCIEAQKKPTVIIARTIKGKGVSFMENKAYWHGVAPSTEELTRALHELGEEF